MHKDTLRRQVKNIRRQFSQQELEKQSLPVLTRLKACLEEAHTVLAYYSLPDEVNTHGLVDELLAEGKTVLLPRLTGRDTMELRRYEGRKDLKEGTFHIMEPVGACFTPKDGIDVALIPGMAFDACGNRLGRGRGYYDRFLSANRSYIRLTIGVCFDFQKVGQVPVDKNDIPVNKVV